MGKRIVFTGGSGKAGRHVVPYLLDKGHKVLNVDRAVLDVPGVHTLLTDVTDAGEVFNALSCHFGYEGYEEAGGPKPADAVVHFAAVPRILMHPDNKTFAENTVSTYNVIEIRRKARHQEGDHRLFRDHLWGLLCRRRQGLQGIPADRRLRHRPDGLYGLSKVVNEKTARAFAMRYGIDVYALRIGNVISPEEYAAFPGYLADPPCRKRNAWAYIDARDLGQIVDLCVAKDGLGFQVFNAVNDTITATVPTREFLAKWAPNTPITGEIDGFDAPLSNRKIRELLGFKEEHDWRKYVKV
ncbi:MAG: NAD(P)-dependent oxidoreductase [Rhizobium sp.]|nr:NAD(P)-dependent oxidoreductase [Rhizobium sp.]